MSKMCYLKQNVFFRQNMQNVMLKQNVLYDQNVVFRQNVQNEMYKARCAIGHVENLTNCA